MFVFTVMGLMGMIVLLYTNELSWYFTGCYKYDQYYAQGLNIVRYHSSYLTAIVRIGIVLLTLICLSLHRVYFSSQSEDKM